MYFPLHLIFRKAKTRIFRNTQAQGMLARLFSVSILATDLDL